MTMNLALHRFGAQRQDTHCGDSHSTFHRSEGGFPSCFIDSNVVHRHLVRERDVMFLGRNPELNVESVVPDFLHVISIRDDTVLIGTLRCQDTAHALRLVTNITVV